MEMSVGRQSTGSEHVLYLLTTIQLVLDVVLDRFIN